MGGSNHNFSMKNLFFFLLISTLLGACCKDYSDMIPGQDFIPADVLQAIEDNGQVIYTGYAPPTLEGEFLMAVPVLVSSNFADPYFPGHIFNNATIEFSEFNAEKLTLKVNITEGTLTGVGYGSFISGQGDDFTVYVKVEATDAKGVKLLQTEVYSGTLEAGGIRNLQRSVFMVNDGGDPNDEYIGNGQGRLAEDSDKFSEKI